MEKIFRTLLIFYSTQSERLLHSNEDGAWVSYTLCTEHSILLDSEIFDGLTAYWRIPCWHVHGYQGSTRCLMECGGGKGLGDIGTLKCEVGRGRRERGVVPRPSHLTPNT